MSIIPFRNSPVYNHPLMGTTHTFRADLPAYDPDSPENKPGHPDFSPGTLLVGAGMQVGVRQVFRNWNGVPGLDMIYVYCFATGMHTHVTPFDLGLTPMSYEVTSGNPNDRRLVVTGGEPFGDALLVERHEGIYFMGDLDAAKQIMTDEYGTDLTEWREGNRVFVGEHRGSAVEPDALVEISDCTQWGVGFTSDEAWRYLIGADFGPIDEHYNEDYLRNLLAEAANR